MTARERTLVLAVGAMVVLMGGYYVYRQIDASFDSRAKTLERLRAEKRQKERQLLAGRLAEQRLQRYQERSLPRDGRLASQRYTDWLLKMVTDIGFAERKVSPNAAVGLRSQTDAYRPHSFTVSGAGTLEMLTRLLYEFYSVDYLHRIKSLNVDPRGPKTIHFTMTVEALSLTDAPERDALHHPPSSRLAGVELKDYVEAICGRNMFGVPNTPPRLTVRNESANTNREIRISPSASDPDKDDKLTYSLESSDLSGARFDPQTGQLTWTPRRAGDYYVTIAVKDDGVPARTAQGKIKITVTDPPPPPPPVVTVKEPPPGPKKPPYTDIQFTFINGITEVNGRRQVWMIDRKTSKNYWLYEGDQFQIGGFTATVKHIGPLDVEFQWYERRALVPLGSNLAEDKELTGGELFNVRQDASAF